MNSENNTQNVATDYIHKSTGKRGITAMELISKQFEPLRWCIPGIIPEGVTLLVGAPKMGKSWIALQMCIAVATGTTALGKVQAEQGEVLYLALEDNERRLQNRLQTLGADNLDTLENLTLDIHWRPMDDGGYEDLDQWLHDYPDTTLVVVDTLKKIKPSSKGGRNAYDVDYESVQPLMELAKSHGTAIVAVHHTNKQNNDDDWYQEVSGSTGLTGGVDNVVLLRGERNKNKATLHVDGRDIEEPGDYALVRTHKGVWSLSDEDAATLNISPERRAVIRVVEEANRSLSPAEVADVLDKDRNNIKVLMSNMAKDGQIARDDKESGKYKLPVTDYSDYQTEEEEAVTMGSGN